MSDRRLSTVGSFFQGLRPEERLTVSEWADKHRIVEGGPRPGPYSTAETPYLRAIMDALSTRSSYREVIYKKAAQIGASEAGFNWIGYKMDISPGVILAVMPTEGQMKRNSKLRIDPMIRATPRLYRKMARGKRSSQNTILQKEFPGGSLVMAGANSASGLRSIPAESLMLDEVDAYPTDLEGEGSPIKLAQARNRNFKRGKTFMPSTPTVAGASLIESQWDKTDQRKFFVPCPHCGTIQVLEWEQMKWAGNDIVLSPPTTYYECKHCEGKIYEKHKRKMLASGEWIPTKPENISPTRIGFHNNSLVSPWFTWAQCVEEFLKAQGNEADMIVFTNTILGETSKASGEAPNWNEVYNKAKDRPRNKPNKHVRFITMGVDIQKNRIATHVIGWGPDKRAWVLDYEELPGNVEEPQVWADLREVIGRKYIREDGLEMPIHKTCIDSGNWADKVYTFCKPYSASKKVVPVKGRDDQSTVYSAPVSVAKTAAGKNAGGVMLYHVGSTLLKKQLYLDLRLNKVDEDPIGPPGYIHLIKLDQTYFEGLVAEEERITYERGYPKPKWFKIFQRNEPLDTMNYARAAASIAGLDTRDNEWMDALCDTYFKRTPKPVNPEDKTLRSDGRDFWGD